MIPASSLDEALKMAYERKGSDAGVVVIPDGVSVMVVKEEYHESEISFEGQR